MKHVKQRLLMHLLVLQDGERRLGVDALRLPAVVDRRLEQRLLHHRVGAGGVGAHLLARGPEVGRRLHGLDALRVDASREQHF